MPRNLKVKCRLKLPLKFNFIATLKLVCVTLIASLITNIAMAAHLLPHRIVYDLTLKEASSRSGISALAGRIVYEFRGSECDGYTVNFRSVSEIFTGDIARVSDQQSSFYENTEDGTFNFVNRSYIDQQLDSEVSGRAEISEEGLLVEFKSEDRDGLTLPKSHFPTENLLDLIERAKAGETIYESRIFDGSDGGEKSLITTSIIGKFVDASDGKNEEVQMLGEAALNGYWPVSVSYFEETEDGDTLPIYRFAFKLYENGVSRDLTMDHGYVVIEGKVSGFEVLEEEANCD